ncbi:hypothetical protein MRS44_017456 [Fusarium solani]|uniref:uncharacterized protein n=1 Tax=Fusarium solani TaxID=169388 RepID=UPI0032C3F9D8|nr:hypothetical protein MRS44_017456 [Fusarium solani]
MAKRKRGRSRQCQRQPTRAPPTSATSGNIEPTPVSALVQSAGPASLVEAFRLQAQFQATAREIVAESICKETAQLHIDYLE